MRSLLPLSYYKINGGGGRTSKATEGQEDYFHVQVEAIYPNFEIFIEQGEGGKYEIMPSQVSWFCDLGHTTTFSSQAFCLLLLSVVVCQKI